eukprot:3326730-Pyramimonas_sp.AAC.1
MHRRNRGQGARLPRETLGQVTAKRPLEGLAHRLELRFKREREHDHEVRKKTTLTRPRCELAFEQDKQFHLQEIGHKSYDAEILTRVTKRLSTVKVNQATKKDMQWVDESALSRINASGREGRRLSDARKQALSKEKAKLT